MQTFEAIINRKGVRSFNNQQITADQLRKLIHAANAAPISGGGFADSARHLTVVQDEVILTHISKAAADKKRGGDPLYGAKMLIIISAPENTYHVEQLDVGIMAQTLLLEATDLGLNSIVMTSFTQALKEDPDLYLKLSIPDKYTPFIGVVVGYTDDETVKMREYKNQNVNYI